MGPPVAGDWKKVYHTIIRPVRHRALLIRGTPLRQVEVHHNWFLAPSPSPIPSGENSTEFLLPGSNAYGPEGSVE